MRFCMKLKLLFVMFTAFSSMSLLADAKSEQKLAEFLRSGFAIYNSAKHHLIIGNQEGGATYANQTIKITVSCIGGGSVGVTNGRYMLSGMTFIDKKIDSFSLTLDGIDAILRAVELSKN